MKIALGRCRMLIREFTGGIARPILRSSNFDRRMSALGH